MGTLGLRRVTSIGESGQEASAPLWNLHPAKESQFVG